MYMHMHTYLRTCVHTHTRATDVINVHTYEEARFF